MKTLNCYQTDVHMWCINCFGWQVANDRIERGKRVVEEALELGQTLGLTKDDCKDLVEYVFDRPTGELTQEIAGVLVTTLAIPGVVASTALQKELDRIRLPEMIEKIRKKHLSKAIAGISMGL